MNDDSEDEFIEMTEKNLVNKTPRELQLTDTLVLGRELYKINKIFKIKPGMWHVTYSSDWSTRILVCKDTDQLTIYLKD